MTPQAETGRKQGGQPGNKNAMRHGFYAKRFTDEEAERLDKQGPTDVQAEIALLRVCLDKLYDQLYFEPTYFNIKNKDKEEVQSNIRDDHYLKQLNTLAIMSQAVATLARTDHLIHGKAGDVQDSILRALEEIRLEMGL